MAKTLQILMSVAVIASFHSSASRGGVTLLGHLTLSQKVTDVWGWYDANANKEYALVGIESSGIPQGFYIIDVTDPADPVQVKRVANVSGFDLKTFGSLVYTVSGSIGTVGGYIVDISKVESPAFAGTFESSHNVTIDPRGYMYLCNASSQHSLVLYSLLVDPTKPQFVWKDNLPNSHDATVVGTRLYDFHGINATRIYDISNPESPLLLGSIADGSIAYHHSGYPTEDGRHLFIADELAKDPSPDVTVWNIEDPSSPFKVAEIRDSVSTVHNLFIVGDFAYVSYYASGFKVFDVSDPTGPELVGEHDTSARAEEGFVGAFGVYPFAPSGNIYVSDIDNGLFVFSFATTAVFISSFDARPVDGGVRMSWAIAHADGLEGFNVYRSEREDGIMARLNAGLLPARAVSFDDYDVAPGKKYWYQLGAVDRDGEFFSTKRIVRLPEPALVLHQNVPNPFNPSTTVSFEIPVAARVVLGVYNGRGERVRVLVDEVRPPGLQSVAWDGRDDDGRRLPSGVYFSRLEVSGRIDTQRMVLLK